MSFKIKLSVVAILGISFYAAFLIHDHFHPPANIQLARSVYGPNFDCSGALSPTEFIEKNARSGHAKSEDEVASWYFRGVKHDKIIKPDLSEAIKWYQQAAEQGNVDAQEHLGIIHAPDLGNIAPQEGTLSLVPSERKIAKRFNVPIDYTEAAKWFFKAAEQGNQNSEYYLSYMFHEGLGVKQSDQEAYFWMGIVIKNHNDKSDRYDLERNKFGALLTDVQRVPLDASITEWKPTKTVNEQKDLIDLPWILCDAKNDRQCTAAIIDGDRVNFFCHTDPLSCHKVINKKTNEIEGEKCAQY